MRARYLATAFGAGVLGLVGSAQDLSSILGAAGRQTERNAKVTGLRFNSVPSDCRVRPLESIVIQVLVDGEIPSSEGEARKGRLRRAPGVLRVTDKDGGWLSKPFKFQGEDPGGYADSNGSALKSIFQKVAGDFTVQDSFLYTAPEKPGTYTLENDTEGVKAQVKVTVDEKAPTNRKPEQVNFNSESRSGEPYRALAERYAPLLAQETWFQPKSDFPTRFDYDNDFIGDNNWDNLDKGTSQAYVYYAAMETATHWFLIYNVFHPRDYSDKCVAGSCHENDNEGLILTVEKNGSESGKLLAMETLAHNNVYSFTSERSIRNGVHDIDGRIDLYEGSHPVVFIESGGHGIYGAALARNSRYNFARDEFTAGTGVTFVYKGAAERPKHPNDRKVGYDLLPILSHWWARASRDRDQRMFDDFGPYEPLGGRPGIPFSRIGRAFLGRKESANKAKPFWGWHDVKTTKENVLAPGQWGLDPAYAVTRDLRFPADMAFSLDYVYNPYLGSAGTVITAASPAIGPPGAESGASILPGVLPSLAEAEEGWIEVQAVVDGSVVLHIEGQQATPEVLSGQPLSESKFQFSGPPPSVAGARWSLEKTSGRGQVKIVEEPSVGNGMTLKVRVDDPQRAADKYVFRVRWKRN